MSEHYTKQEFVARCGVMPLVAGKLYDAVERCEREEMKLTEKFTKAEFLSRCGIWPSASELLYNHIKRCEDLGIKVQTNNNCTNIDGTWTITSTSASPLSMVMHGRRRHGNTGFFHQVGAVLGITWDQADSIDDGMKDFCVWASPQGHRLGKAMREMFLETRSTPEIASKVVYL